MNVLFALTYHVPILLTNFPLYTTKERLHNVGEQELVGRNDRYHVFQRSDNRRALFTYDHVINIELRRRRIFFKS